MFVYIFFEFLNLLESISLYIFWLFEDMTDQVKNEKSANRPVVIYRVELEKRIEVNKSFSDKRNQAMAMRTLTYGLFGKKRYQNLYLVSSLNCFQLALRIANEIHQRVAGLAMIIRFETSHVLEYFKEEFEGAYFEDKKYSKIAIKLTRNPTEEDKKEPGYHEALTSDQIEEPLEGYFCLDAESSENTKRTETTETKTKMTKTKAKEIKTKETKTKTKETKTKGNRWSTEKVTMHLLSQGRETQGRETEQREQIRRRCSSQRSRRVQREGRKRPKKKQQPPG